MIKNLENSGSQLDRLENNNKPFTINISEESKVKSDQNFKSFPFCHWRFNGTSFNVSMENPL
jgi:hypothetical protein